MLAFVFGLTLLLFQSADEKIEIIQEGFLDLRPGTPIGQAFDGYSWWKTTSWKIAEREPDGELIDFTGRFLASEAAAEFKKNHQYKFRMSLKYMQLKPIYGIGEHEEEHLSLTIRFILRSDRSFSVHSGRLGLMNPGDQSWRFVTLSDKAVVSMIKAFYHQIDPYTALVNGLPYK